MTVEELLISIRTLSRTERVQLIHTLIDELTRPDLPSDEEIAGAFFMQEIHGGPGGMVMAAALQRLLDDHKNGIAGA